MDTCIQPMYSKIHMPDGIMVIKHEVLGPFDHSVVGKLEDAARKYQKKRNSYQRAAKTVRSRDIDQRIVAGLILHFAEREEEFLPRGVLIWAAFADENLTLQQVQSALNKLKPISCTTVKGYWKVDRDKLRDYLECRLER